MGRGVLLSLRNVLIIVSIMLFFEIFYSLITSQYAPVFFSILLASFFAVAVIYKKRLRFTEKINLLLTLSIVFLSFIQVWTIWYQSSPRTIGPVFVCPDQISQNGTTQEISFGNYGQNVGYLRFHWIGQNLIASSSYEPNKMAFDLKTTVPFPPISGGGSQTKISYFIRVANPKLILANFSLNWIDVSNEFLIDSFAIPIREFLIMKHDCEYQKINDTYNLVRYNAVLSQ